MADTSKDTIYIDIDDEITAIIEKVRASKQKIVALVLPKRATTLQSIVNMKLLKRTGEETGKRIVLITSEAGLIPLAGVVGLYVAKTLQSKPAIPPTPDTSETTDTLDDDEPVTDEEPELDESKTVGELAGMAAIAGAAAAKDDAEADAHPAAGATVAGAAAAGAASAEPDETIDVDNTEPDETTATSGSKKDKKAKKDKTKKVPNFDGFRKKFFIGIFVLLLLIVGWYVAFKVLPKATITVTTDNTKVAINATFTADTTASTVNADASVIPAQLKTEVKTDSTQVTASGQQDNGTKASGAVTLTLKDCSQNQVSIPAGSGVSSNGLTFITQSAVSLSSVVIGGTCRNGDFPTVSSGTVNVVSQQNGDKYNLAASQAFTVAGFSNVSGSNGAAMTGGTSNIVKVVTQADVDAGKQKLLDKNGPVAKTDLAKQFQAIDYQPILETFSAGTPVVTSTPAVGAQADTVTVNAVITYTMLGVKHSDLQAVVSNAAKGQIDLSKQPIQDYGFDQLTFTVLDGSSPNKVKVSMQTNATAGSKLDSDSLKQQVAGKKKGDVQQIIGDQPGVKDVTVQLSPFYVSKIPTNPKRITIVFIQSNGN